MPDAHKEGLVRLLAERNVPLIEDDTYGEMYFGKARPRTCKSFDRAGMVLYCASVTKSLAPGYRVGWCIPGKFMEPVMQLKLTSSVSSTTPTHAAIGHFIATSRYDLHIRNLRKTLHLQSLQYLRAVLEYFPDDTQVAPPQGGYNLWLRLNPAINAYLLFKEALRHRISIAPGHLFSPDGKFAHYVRISFVPPFTPQIEESIKTLGRLAHGLLAAQPASLPAF
jgi:DNA-binding transcriptional MocR family regulator